MKRLLPLALLLPCLFLPCSQGVMAVDKNEVWSIEQGIEENADDIDDLDIDRVLPVHLVFLVAYIFEQPSFLINPQAKLSFPLLLIRAPPVITV